MGISVIEASMINIKASMINIKASMVTSFEKTNHLAQKIQSYAFAVARLRYTCIFTKHNGV